MEELLQQQRELQGSALNQWMEENDIEAAWDVPAIYQAIADERVNAARRRSAEWLQTRLNLGGQIPKMEMARCKALEQELGNPPAFLSQIDSQKVDNLLMQIKLRIEELAERRRLETLAQWQAPFLSLWDVSDLDAKATESLLKQLRNPPCELTTEEQAKLGPLSTKLTAHLDQLSVDEMVGRIEKLKPEGKRHIFALLKQWLGQM